MFKQFAFAAVVSALIPTAALGAAPLAHADDHYMAMAIGDARGDVGFGGGPSAAVASAHAMKACSSHGSTDCAVVATGKDGCVADANDAPLRHTHGAWGETRSAAASAALAKAGSGGQVYSSKCVGDPTDQGGTY